VDKRLISDVAVIAFKLSLSTTPSCKWAASLIRGSSTSEKLDRSIVRGMSTNEYVARDCSLVRYVMFTISLRSSYSASHGVVIELLAML
jgi:hypothetical protein